MPAGVVKSITVVNGIVTAASGGLVASADMSTTGVTAGSYTLSSITVDAQGRITAASSGSGGSGTVTSVAMTLPSFLSVAGSPITTAGTLAVTLVTQTANFIFAGPTSGSAAAPTFRAVVAADLGTGTANSTKYLRGDLTWTTFPTTSGTVTSVDASGGTTGLTFSGGPITGSGTLTLAGTLAVANGGTGLTALAANTFPARASTGALAAKTITDFGLSLVDDATANDARITLGLIISTDVQAYSATLTALAGISAAANGFITQTSSGVFTTGVVTDDGSTTLVTNGATAPQISIRNTYTGQATIVTVGTITTGTWGAGTIAVNKGGSGATTLTGYLKGNGTSAFTASATIPAADYPTMVAAGGSHAKGAVPDPGATAHANQPYVLRDDGTWLKISGQTVYSSFVATLEATASTTAVSLTTVQSVTFTLDATTTVEIHGGVSVQQSTALAVASLWATVDGTPVRIGRENCTTAAANYSLSGGYTVSLAAGSHTIALQYSTNAGTATFSDRYFIVRC